MACSNGPDNTAWDGTQCVSTPQQTSCDSVNQTTCYYACLQFSPIQYLGGQFPKGTESGDFQVGDVGIPELGINPRDVIGLLNGVVPTSAAILAFTAAFPATQGSCYRRAGVGDNRLEVTLQQ